MSPSEVVSASKGGAVADPDSEELTAPFSSGEYQFQAAFKFKDGKLTSVDLSGVTGPACYKLTGDLKAKYGMPSEHYPLNETYWWLDKAGNNQVMVTTMMDLKCYIHYEPLTNANNLGL